MTLICCDSTTTVECINVNVQNDIMFLNQFIADMLIVQIVQLDEDQANLCMLVIVSILSRYTMEPRPSTITCVFSIRVFGAHAYLL